MKKISELLLSSFILLQFTNASANAFESNLLTECGGETGYGQKVGMYIPPPFSIFEETLPFVNATICRSLK